MSEHARVWSAIYHNYNMVRPYSLLVLLRCALILQQPIIYIRVIHKRNINFVTLKDKQEVRKIIQEI